ncbi:MAG TPA: hypothetical protein VMT95_01625 [Candidatus Binatia bacterium]|nr:hypothetical protein [Candidatus Binatia bacterium]
MRKQHRLHFAAAASLLLAACSPIGGSPLTAGPGSALRASSASSPAIYAYSPDKALVASYSAGAQGRTRPNSLLEGSATQLSTGNGMAIGSDGTIYVVVYDAGSSHGPLKLLVFPPNAHGNAAPERTAVLRGPVLPGHATGLALDGHGNFWLSAIGKLLRYPTSAQGRVRPNASIALELDTPDGYMPAHSDNVALDTAGNVYCSCTVVYRGAQAIGVSEYALTSGRATLVRSFYDFTLPEVPPSSIAIDAAGTIYLASSLPNTGVFAYGPKTGSGHVTPTRRFAWGSGVSIHSIATDAAGDVYAGAGSRITVLGPRSNGHVRPLRTIADPRHLEYVSDTYGTLLNVR